MKNHQDTPACDEKHRMIAEAAYYRAEKRGFAGGDPVEDWLAAEAEVEQVTEFHETEAQRQEQTAYERMHRELRKILADVRDTVSADTIKHALEKANKELQEIGEFAPDALNKASKTIKLEIANAVENLGPRWEVVSGRTTELFGVWKNRGAEFLNQASIALNDWVARHRSKNPKDTKSPTRDYTG
jgi:hypothetical protein